jgi:hypothetical protein
MPCIITGYYPTNPASQTYTVTDPTYSWFVPINPLATQVPACGYTYSVTTSNVPVFVTAVVSGLYVTFSA